MLFEAPTLDTLWGYQLHLALPAIWLATSVMIVLLVDIFIAVRQDDIEQVPLHFHGLGDVRDLGGLVAEHQRGEKAERHHRRPTIEHQPLQECAAVMVEVAQVGNNGQI